MQNKHSRVYKFYQSLNIIERNELVMLFTDDVLKQAEKNLKTKEKQIESAGSAKGVTMAILAMANVIWNHWGKLNRRATRLKNAFDLFNLALELIEEPDEKQLAVEAELTKQTGCEIVR